VSKPAGTRTGERITVDNPVLCEERDGVLVVTLNRPEARNAINLAVAAGVAAAMARLDADPDLVVGVLTGAGGLFCAGMDLKAFAQGEFPTVEGRGFGGLVRHPPRKPLIAAVEGWALAGGFEMALACDLIVAARDAHFGIPEAKRGLVAGGGGLLRLPKRVPYHVAMELALTGDPIDAPRAAELGLVTALCEPGGALDAALALAARITPNAPLALDASKRLIAATLDWDEAEAWERQSAIADPVFASEDAREGATAFAEKRPPVWRGR
jgi:enoyl-CoA hydratase